MTSLRVKGGKGPGRVGFGGGRGSSWDDVGGDQWDGDGTAGKESGRGVCRSSLEGFTSRVVQTENFGTENLVTEDTGSPTSTAGLRNGVGGFGVSETGVVWGTGAGLEVRETGQYVTTCTASATRRLGSRKRGCQGGWMGHGGRRKEREVRHDVTRKALREGVGDQI